jgi:hypothetical protein
MCKNVLLAILRPCFSRRLARLNCSSAPVFGNPTGGIFGDSLLSDHPSSSGILSVTEPSLTWGGVKSEREAQLPHMPVAHSTRLNS